MRAANYARIGAVVPVIYEVQNLRHLPFYFALKCT
jgi:hypothetical protein